MSIRHLLEKLGYKVKTKENLPVQQMLEEAQRFTNDDSHSGCHSCIVVVMTHGKYDEICGTDDKAIKVDDFVECFNAPGLDGKPKLFFIQACREMESDRRSVQRSAPRRDVLVAYPTAPKCLAYRHKTKGSPFIQSVCEVFIKYAHSESVESMLKRVSNRVY
ncbi:Cell death protein 3 precursor [Aphelenchoides avenae]|nr:Cell death protein 3 precursor [Aphelenchus avenae]